MSQVLRLQVAFIPSVAKKTTLVTLQQPALRAIVLDEMYKVGSELQSMSLTQGPSTTNSFFELACIRFATELCLTDVPIQYCSVGTLHRELARYASGGDSMYGEASPMRHNGLLMVTGLASASLAAREEVGEFLIERIGYGCGIIVCHDKTTTGETHSLGRLASVLNHSLKVVVSEPAKSGKGAASV